MQAVNTATSTSKLHYAWGLTTRASGIVALCSTNTPAQRKKHVTSRNVGESRVFFIDLGIGRVDRETAVAYIVADRARAAFWCEQAALYGYTPEQALTVLSAVVAKTAKVVAMPQAEQEPAEDDAQEPAASIDDAEIADESAA